ncbi:MAG: type IV secretion system protein [Alphaproteobacteria bacterium]|nr:type IV secretion system protein [Alphaproteobacteria bacterium]
MENQEELREKQFLWTARAFAIFCVVTVCCNIVLFFAMINIVPLQRVTPYFLTTNDRQNQNISVVSENARSLLTNDRLTEALVRQYIVTRTTVVADEAEMHRRWGVNSQIHRYSSPLVFEAFIRNRAVEDTFNRIRTSGLSRDVVITSVSAQQLGTGMWQAEISVREMRSDLRAPIESRYRIGMQVEFMPNFQVRHSDRLMNPLGFQVVQYINQPIEH